jgi:hypothetical protein
MRAKKHVIHSTFRVAIALKASSVMGFTPTETRKNKEEQSVRKRFFEP